MYVTSSQLVFNKRAGITAFGRFVPLQDTDLICNGFDLDAEPLNGTPGQFQNLGGNSCGCSNFPGECTAQSSGLTAPSLITDPL